MKRSLLLAGLLAVSGPLAAQSLPAVAMAGSLATPPVAAAAAPDTVDALHRLFAARRRQRNMLVAGTVVGAMVGTAATPPDRLLSTNDYAKLYGLAAAAVIIIYFVCGDTYSYKEEQRAVASFGSHQLPKYLKRRLKSCYFQQPAR
jgi:hypothetical protein